MPQHDRPTAHQAAVTAGAWRPAIQPSAGRLPPTGGYGFDDFGRHGGDGGDYGDYGD